MLGDVSRIWVGPLYQNVVMLVDVSWTWGGHSTIEHRGLAQHCEFGMESSERSQYWHYIGRLNQEQTNTWNRDCHNKITMINLCTCSVLCECRGTLFILSLLMSWGDVHNVAANAHCICHCQLLLRLPTPTAAVIVNITENTNTTANASATKMRKPARKHIKLDRSYYHNSLYI